MNALRTLLISATAIYTAPTMAHTGPEALNLHFAEHVSIALAIGLPVTLGLLRWLKRARQSRQ